MFILQFLRYAGLLFVALLGLPLGVLIASTAKDEVFLYRRYFHPLQNALLVLFFLVLLFTIPLYISIIFFFLALLFLYITWQRLSYTLSEIVLFSILFVLFSLHIDSLFFGTIVIFAFTFVTGLIFFVTHTKSPEKKFVSVRHHKHSSKDLSILEMIRVLSKRYCCAYFFSLATFVLAYFFAYLFF